MACEDVEAGSPLVVNFGSERQRIGLGMQVIGVSQMAAMLAAFQDRRVLQHAGWIFQHRSNLLISSQFIAILDRGPLNSSTLTG